MRLRMSDWAPLLDTSDVNHGLLLPILLHCRDDQGRPLLGPTRRGREAREFLRNAPSDIPAVVEAMRQYWMPTRYARASWLRPGGSPYPFLKPKARPGLPSRRMQFGLIRQVELADIQ